MKYRRLYEYLVHKLYGVSIEKAKRDPLHLIQRKNKVKCDHESGCKNTKIFCNKHHMSIRHLFQRIGGPRVCDCRVMSQIIDTNVKEIDMEIMLSGHFKRGERNGFHFQI